MGARRYRISLDSSRVSAANEWVVELNTRREIPYLQATTYYFVYHTNTISLYWEEKPTSLMNENNWIDNPRITTGSPISRLEKKPMINSWTRHAFGDSVLSYELVQCIARKKRTWKFRYKTLVSSEIRGEFWYWDMSQRAMILDRKIWLRKTPIGRIFGTQTTSAWTMVEIGVCSLDFVFWQE